MSGKDNIETIKNVYAAFGRGDVGAIIVAVTDDVDWASDTSSDGAPWYGEHAGKAGVGAFFEDFGKAMEVEEFTPLTFASNDGGDVLTVVRFVARSRRPARSRRCSCTTGSASQTGRSRTTAAPKTPRSRSTRSPASRRDPVFRRYGRK